MPGDSVGSEPEPGARPSPGYHFIAVLFHRGTSWSARACPRFAFPIAGSPRMVRAAGRRPTGAGDAAGVADAITPGSKTPGTRNPLFRPTPEGAHIVATDGLWHPSGVRPSMRSGIPRTQPSAVKVASRGRSTTSATVTSGGRFACARHSPIPTATMAANPAPQTMRFTTCSGSSSMAGEPGRLRMTACPAAKVIKLCRRFVR